MTPQCVLQRRDQPAPRGPPGAEPAPQGTSRSHQPLRGAGRGFWKEEPGGQRLPPAAASPARPRAGLSTPKAAWHRRLARRGCRGDGTVLVAGRHRPVRGLSWCHRAETPLFGVHGAATEEARGVSGLRRKQDSDKATVATVAAGVGPSWTGSRPCRPHSETFFLSFLARKPCSIFLMKFQAIERKGRPSPHCGRGSSGSPRPRGRPRPPAFPVASDPDALGRVRASEPPPRSSLTGVRSSVGLSWGSPLPASRSTTGFLSLSLWPDTALSQAACRERPCGCPLLHAPPPRGAEGP